MATPTDPPGKPGKAGSKKTILILGAAAAAVVLFLYLKSKKITEEGATGEAGLASQSFIPVTGEGAGGGAFSGGVSGNEGGQAAEAIKENNTFMREFLATSSANQTAANQALEAKITSLTAGGTPASGQAGTGAGAASPASGGTAASPPPVPAAVAKAAAPAAIPMNTISKAMTGPKGAHVTCQCHEYPKGKSGHGGKEFECQHVSGGHCVW